MGITDGESERGNRRGGNHRGGNHRGGTTEGISHHDKSYTAQELRYSERTVPPIGSNSYR